jgi:hypothetical protein
MKGKKTGGRSKGTPNKVTEDVREALGVFMKSNFTDFETHYKKLSSKAKVFTYVKLLPYVTPAFSPLTLDPNKLPEEYLNQLYQHALTRLKDENKAQANDGKNQDVNPSS